MDTTCDSSQNETLGIAAFLMTSSSLMLMGALRAVVEGEEDQNTQVNMTIGITEDMLVQTAASTIRLFSTS